MRAALITVSFSFQRLILKGAYPKWNGWKYLYR